MRTGAVVRILSPGLVLLATLGSAAPAPDAAASIAKGYWSTADAAVLVPGEHTLPAGRSSVLAVDRHALDAALRTAPAEGAKSGTIIALPWPDGRFLRYRVFDSPIMAPALAAEFPEIRTYSVQGVDEPAATGRLDLTPAGFHGMVFTPKGTVMIDPWSRTDADHAVAYFKRDLPRDDDHMRCLFKNAQARTGLAPRPADEGIQPSHGTQLRTYRLALAATGEYTAFFGGTVSGAMAGMTTTMNRVNGVYERDFAVRMVMVANNSSIVYTNAATDPYTNDDGFTMLDENQANLDTVIGSANYDIGHVFSTGGGGVAELAAVCTAGHKAQGVTGSPSPTGDGYDIDYVAHEMGHQFGGNNTFNSEVGACGGGNREPSAAYEPGSGSTIMAYAGICDADDLQPDEVPQRPAPGVDQHRGRPEAPAQHRKAGRRPAQVPAERHDVAGTRPRPCHRLPALQ